MKNIYFQTIMQDSNTIKTIGRYSYYTQKCLGEGSFGKVFEGFENTTKDKVAIKKVDFKTIEKDAYLQKAIHDEIKILNKFKHPNIVQLHEVLNSKRSLYIIMEYCKDGDLKKYLRKKEKISDQEAFAAMKQVITGYQELARQNTIHRDLKPANILINNNLFKICDFGFSKVIKDPNTALKTCVGSPIYMAPQILQKKDYSAKCDIWSLGIIYYELLHGTVPWTARSEKQLLAKIKSESFTFTRGSAATEKIIRQMLEVSEEKRATLRDLELFFGLESDSVVNINSNLKWNIAEQPSSVRTIQTENIAFTNKSVTAVQTKVVNRNYFEELAWRYFVCAEIRTKLSFLNRYNFKQNIFERYIVLLISSILCNFKRRINEIERIHEKDVIIRVKAELDIYREFQLDFYEYLAENYATCQIVKEFDLIDVAQGNFTEEVIKRSEMDLNKNSQSILKQLQEQAKVNNSQENERNSLFFIAEIILDMILLNEKQAKTGLSQIETALGDRHSKPIDKRISAKLTSLKEVKVTEFF